MLVRHHYYFIIIVISSSLDHRHHFVIISSSSFYCHCFIVISSSPFISLSFYCHDFDVIILPSSFHHSQKWRRDTLFLAKYELNAWQVWIGGPDKYASMNVWIDRYEWLNIECNWMNLSNFLSCLANKLASVIYMGFT